ncbi:TetR/AcrR family transcriptional regulator [Geodermatophilus sp. SYSU D00079]
MTRPPRSAQAEGSRERILAAAAAIAAEAGYEGTTISKVTQRSGLPVSSVYWFFKDKDELLAEVVAHSFEQWMAGQPDWSPSTPGDTLPDRLRYMLDRSVRSLADAPDFLRIGQMITLENRATEPAARTRYLRIRVEVEGSITAWFSDGLGDDVRARHPELARTLARFLIATTDGYFLATQIDEPWDPAELVDLLVGTVAAVVTEAAADGC